MKVFMFEGTDEEFKSISHLFSGSSIFIKEKSLHEDMDKVVKIEPVAAIRKMLTRRPIPNGQLSVYKALSKDKVEYNEFLKGVRKTTGQIAGVFGALGRRINKTEEIHKAGLLGNTRDVLKWDYENGKYYLSLTPNALEALKAEGII